MLIRISLLFILIQTLSFAASASDPNCTTTYTGEGTFYGYGGGGNCSLPFEGAPAITGAMNEVQYNGSQICGACVEVKGRKGSLVIRIEDRCPECKHGDIDLSEDAFPYIDDKEHGRVPIEWKLVPCPVKGPVKFEFKKGSSEYWTAVQIRNHAYPIAKFEYKANGKWVEVERTMFNYFVVQDGMGPAPYDFRVTDILGNELVEINVPFIEDAEIEATQTFSGNSITHTPQCPELRKTPEIYPLPLEGRIMVCGDLLAEHIISIKAYNLQGILVNHTTAITSNCTYLTLPYHTQILIIQVQTDKDSYTQKILYSK